MTKTKFKRRIENAAAAFFAADCEKSGEDGLTFARADSALRKQENAARFAAKGDILLRFLKRAFLFFPGAFYLFFGMMSVFAFDFIRLEPFAVVPIFLIGGLMTILGIGNVKNPKHLAIPLSISAVGVAAYAVFSMFGGVKAVFDYGVYFFPLALIAPFLAKSLVDKTDATEN